MRTLLFFITVLFFGSCREQYYDEWESSIVDLDSIKGDANTRKVASASYLDSAQQKLFLSSPICLSPIIDTSTEYWNSLFMLSDSIPSKFQEIVNHSKLMPVDLRNYIGEKQTWCDIASKDRSGGFIKFFNARRVRDHASVTVSVELLPKSGKVFTLFLEKVASNEWVTIKTIELAVF